jgi:hypothetical protein
VQLRHRCPRVKRDRTAGLVGCWIKWPPKAAPPSRRVRPPASIALDRDLGRPPAAGHGRWQVRDAPSACAASLASSAALPVPARCHGGQGRNPYVILYVNPYVIPYAQGWRTPGFAGRAHQYWSVPLRGASQPQKPRLTGPPSGEWSGRAEWCASRD